MPLLALVNVRTLMASLCFATVFRYRLLERTIRSEEQQLTNEIYDSLKI